MTYLLDTNHCSRIIFGETNLIRRLQEHIGLGVATSVIVQGELLYMVQKSSEQEANLRFVRTFLQTIDLYPISGEVADIYGSLKGKIQDLRIDKLNKKCVEMNQQKTGDR
ncbi:type II toxin-antitoxin system VapC family toxin [Nostoc commune]|uniref:type II toxin-antitoxin system VapC family toxin n=1 Tax=Nostoc commune TaxID=1178 RepID=UPI002ED7F377